MSTSHSTSKDGTREPSMAGRSSQSPHRRAPEDSDTIGEIFGNAYTFGSMDEKEPKAGMLISDCDYVLLYSGAGRTHPIGIHCTVHNWDGNITDND